MAKKEYIVAVSCSPMPSRGWSIARLESAKRRAADAQCTATSRRCADRCAR